MYSLLCVSLIPEETLQSPRSALAAPPLVPGNGSSPVRLSGFASFPCFRRMDSHDPRPLVSGLSDFAWRGRGSPMSSRGPGLYPFS